jgi:hypothetical protein
MLHDHDDDTGPPLPSPADRRPRRALGASLIAVAISLLASACSDNDSQPLEDFVGTWVLTSDTTQTNNARLLCSTAMIDTDFALFNQVVLKEGTLSDLYESAGPGDCQFGFDAVPAKGTSAIVSPDPYKSKAAGCTVSLGTQADAVTMDSIETLLALTPSNWQFNLKAPVKGKAPGAQLIGQAVINVTSVDLDTNPQMVVGTIPCTYDLLANLDKVTRD